MIRLRKQLFALAVSAVALTGMAAPDWQAQVDQLIAQGEFARAEKVMKSLPKKVRQADAAIVTIGRQAGEGADRDIAT